MQCFVVSLVNSRSYLLHQASGNDEIYDGNSDNNIDDGVNDNNCFEIVDDDNWNINVYVKVYGLLSYENASVLRLPMTIFQTRS